MLVLISVHDVEWFLVWQRHLVLVNIGLILFIHVGGDLGRLLRNWAQQLVKSHAVVGSWRKQWWRIWWQMTHCWLRSLSIVDLLLKVIPNVKLLIVLALIGKLILRVWRLEFLFFFILGIRWDLALGIIGKSGAHLFIYWLINKFPQMLSFDWML